MRAALGKRAGSDWGSQSLAGRLRRTVDTSNSQAMGRMGTYSGSFYRLRMIHPQPTGIDSCRLNCAEGDTKSVHREVGCGDRSCTDATGRPAPQTSLLGRVLMNPRRRSGCVGGSLCPRLRAIADLTRGPSRASTGHLDGRLTVHLATAVLNLFSSARA
jgi:hypothetical protein